ncbi:MAG TPA: selenocysteine-specific translation elongation factor [Planctomycetota bacterium]|nr:selenocysteine-specific translation elongation factor [Planctomycetota bacterium]
MKKNLETIRNVVIGTAGHIDHGKSTLVERLTGIHPDRLPEEKTRGLTIDLGFAPLVLKTGQRVGIIDVPGHERLVKNMVAGATGMDLVLLVVAADDGVMPQTREHVTIMQLLGIETGIVVLTKIDMVDLDLRELVRQDLRDTLEGTFLANEPIVEVSSTTGEGIDGLLEAIHAKVLGLEPKDSTGIFRMPIQRVFSAKGFGTVVTGVPLGGKTEIGETLEVVPLGRKGRVRGIHAYGEATDMARAGHSSAINLTDTDYREVHRGMVLTQVGYFQGATMFEARFHHLASARRPLAHQTSIRLHVGTVEGIGKVFLLEKKTLEPGEEAYVQFRLDEPIVAVPGDRFILRLHSPLETIGGGEILDQSRWRLKTGKAHVIDILREKESALGDPGKFLSSVLLAAGYETLPERQLAVRCGLSVEEARTIVERLVGEGEVRPASRAGSILSCRRLEEAKLEALRAAETFFRKNPRRRFIDKLHLRQTLGASDVFFEDLVAEIEKQGIATEETGGRLRFRDHGPKLGPEEEEIRRQVLAALNENPFTPPSPAEMAASQGRAVKDVEEITALLEEEGEVLRAASDVFFHKDAVEDARRRIREHLAAHKTMTASDAKNVLGSTRKYSIPLLEQLDKEGFTVRRGDLRELRKT